MSHQVEIIRKLAAEDNAEAQWELAQYYWEHPECGKTPYDGIEWARKVAEQGHPEAEAEVGCFCEEHFDDPQAAMWYERAAAHGNVLGDYYLGLFYKEGRGGLPRDLERAGQCFLRVSKYAEAAYEYYECYRERVGDNDDDGWEQAIGLLMQSADGGYAPAQYELGLLYESAARDEESQKYLKDSAKQKYHLAVEYLKTAADQKYSTAYAGLAQHSIHAGDYETALGYLKKGVKRDRTGECSYWYAHFWEHNYGDLLPWDESRPNVASRIQLAAGWYAYSYMCGYEPALEQLIRCSLIDCKAEPTPENIAAVGLSRDKNGNLRLSIGDTITMFYCEKPNW